MQVHPDQVLQNNSAPSCSVKSPQRYQLLQRQSQIVGIKQSHPFPNGNQCTCDMSFDKNLQICQKYPQSVCSQQQKYFINFFSILHCFIFFKEDISVMIHALYKMYEKNITHTCMHTRTHAYTHEDKKRLEAKAMQRKEGWYLHAKVWSSSQDPVPAGHTHSHDLLGEVLHRCPANRMQQAMTHFC